MLLMPDARAAENGSSAIAKPERLYSSPSRTSTALVAAVVDDPKAKGSTYPPSVTSRAAPMQSSSPDVVMLHAA